MEPDTGASTWALGSQIWRPNNGTFTKNPVNSIKEIKIVKLLLEINLNVSKDKIKNFPDWNSVFQYKISINKGREAKIVYINI